MPGEEAVIPVDEDTGRDGEHGDLSRGGVAGGVRRQDDRGRGRGGDGELRRQAGSQRRGDGGGVDRVLAEVRVFHRQGGRPALAELRRVGQQVRGGHVGAAGGADQLVVVGVEIEEGRGATGGETGELHEGLVGDDEVLHAAEGVLARGREGVGDALLRPGRFDRQISVEAPDLAGRSHILQVHAVGKPLAEDIDLDSVARRTPGFSGADLANVLNEAALLAARMNLNVIGQPQLDEAIDRVIAGPQKRTRLMNDRERLITAYHEGGHALVAAAMPGNDPVQKVTILPRGRALGYTMVMPDDDKYSHTRGELLDQMAYMMGGRAAEEMIFHDPTTGAQNDIEKATKVARAMVTQYGMSERVGAVQLGGGDSEPFMGMRGAQPSKDISEASAAIIDEEVAKLINAAHHEAYEVLSENREVLDELVRQLFAKETLNKAEVAEVFKNLKRRDKRPAWTGSDLRVPSDIPPVEVPPAVVPQQQGALPAAGPAEGQEKPDRWDPPGWAPPSPGDRR